MRFQPQLEPSNSTLYLLASILCLPVKYLSSIWYFYEFKKILDTLMKYPTCVARVSHEYWYLIRIKYMDQTAKEVLVHHRWKMLLPAPGFIPMYTPQPLFDG